MKAVLIIQYVFYIEDNAISIFSFQEKEPTKTSPQTNKKGDTHQCLQKKSNEKSRYQVQPEPQEYKGTSQRELDYKNGRIGVQPTYQPPLEEHTFEYFETIPITTELRIKHDNRARNMYTCTAGKF